jgi:4a-hydroxytetrahydrobiopterin dehydratase
MWQETKHGLYRQFNFDDFKQAWSFMQQVAELAEKTQHHPRWENEWSVVQIWLITHEGGQKVTDKDHEMAAAIDEIFGDAGPQGEQFEHVSFSHVPREFNKLADAAVNRALDDHLGITTT